MVHTRDTGVDSLLSLLEKLSAWFYPAHYTIVEIKMAAIKEWGDGGPVSYESLTMKDLELKITFCEELEKIVGVIEGDMSRTKGFILLSFLRTLDYMKEKELQISQVKIVQYTKGK